MVSITTGFNGFWNSKLDGIGFNTTASAAKFAKMPPIKEKAAVDKAIDVLTDVWKLPRASVLISVTGGAQAFSSADTYSLEPPYGTYGLRVPVTCVLYITEAQGSLPPGPHALQVRGTRASLGRAARATYRVVQHHRQQQPL